MPRTDYPLEFGSPQADFTKTSAAIKKLGWNDTAQIVSPYPAMDKLYLGRSTLLVSAELKWQTGRNHEHSELYLHGRPAS